MKSSRLIESLKLIGEECDLLDIKDIPLQISEEISEIILEYFEYLYSKIDIQDVERRVSLSKKIDLYELEKALILIKEGKPKRYRLSFADVNTREINPSDIINNMKAEIEKIRNQGSQIDSYEILTKIEFSYDWRFDELIIAMDISSPVLPQLKGMVINKLNLVPNDDILLL